MLFAGGTYESSLILFESIWNKENFPVKGDIVIAIPNRDVVLVTGTENKSGLNHIQRSTDDLYENGSYQISNKIFVWNGDKFREKKEYWS